MAKSSDTPCSNTTPLTAFTCASHALLVLDQEHRVIHDNAIARLWLSASDEQPAGFSDLYFAAHDIQLSDRDGRLLSALQLIETPDAHPYIAIHRANQTRWLKFHLTQLTPTSLQLEFYDVSGLMNEITDLRQRADNAVSTDATTKLYNRRYAIERLEQMHHHAKRYQSPFTIAMIDIDYFKRINDTFGHQFGDEVLERLAKVIKHSFRETDLCARYGGEEFLVLMPETHTSEAILSLDRLRQQVSELKWDQMQRPVTISSGVISWQENKSVEQLIFLADQRLSTAKKAGRNQVCGDLI